jgi:hypothetical protein
MGERLRVVMRLKLADMSPFLPHLVDRLGELDHISSLAVIPPVEEPHNPTISKVVEPA